MADLKKLKNSNVWIILLGMLCVLVFINIIMSFQDKGIGNITGLAVEETPNQVSDEFNKLVNEVSSLRKENERLVLEKDSLSKKIADLEGKIKTLEEEKQIEEETCPLPCGVEELCSPVNKKDGSVEWQCVDDPSKYV